MTIRYENRDNSVASSSIGSGEFSYTWEHPNHWAQLKEMLKPVFGDKTDSFVAAMEQNARSLEDFMDFAYLKGNGGSIDGNVAITGDLTVDGFPIVPVPTGTIAMYAGASAPTGWVLCNGAAYDASNPLYSSLGAICNGAYDTSAGQSAPATGYFRVPILKGKMPLGYDGLGFQLGDDGLVTTSGGTGNPGYLVVNYIIKL